MSDKPRQPVGLAPAGRQLWRRLTSSFEFEAAELAILETAARQRDALADLEAAVAADGLMVTGSAGQPRLHPAAVEARQARMALGRLLGMLALPVDADDRPQTAAGRSARRAAETRWTRLRREREQREAALEDEGA